MSDIFVIYSHSRPDSRICDLLRKHLQVLFHNYGITYFSDAGIEEATKWEEAIDAHLRDAKCAIVVITADSMGSEFIRNKEIPWFVKNGKRIFCLYFSPVDIPDELRQYQLSPRDETGRLFPLKTLPETDWEGYLVKFVGAVRDFLKPEYRSDPPPAEWFSLDYFRHDIAKNLANSYNSTDDEDKKVGVLKDVIQTYVLHHAHGRCEEARDFIGKFDEHVDKLADYKIESTEHGIELYSSITTLLKKGLPKPTHFLASEISL